MGTNNKYTVEQRNIVREIVKTKLLMQKLHNRYLDLDVKMSNLNFLLNDKSIKRVDGRSNKY